MAKISERNAPPTGYIDGTMETRRFADQREAYWTSIRQILEMGVAPADLIHHAPAFAGHVNLARYLALYEAYKTALPYSGHIAECGIFKGTCTIYFAKLTRMFEPTSNTLVHGFDWFQGARLEDDEAKLVETGLYHASFEWVSKLVSVQGLDDIVRLHNLDLTKELPAFFAQHPHLHFKLVLLDCGIYKAVRACLEHFWPRLAKGGVLILDNFNHETAPGETVAVRELLPDQAIRSFGFAFQPTAYLVKD